MSTWLGSEYISLLNRIDAALLARHERNCPWPTTSGAITTRKAAEMGQDAREGGSKAMEAVARPIPQDAPETPVSGPEDYTGVIQTAMLNKIVWLTRERDDLRARLAERDAQVGRLTKRLSEGLG